jgi:hypothetical protein
MANALDGEPELAAFVRGGRITSMPAKRARRLLLLDCVAQEFEPGRQYREAEVSEILRGLYDDHAELRCTGAPAAPSTSNRFLKRSASNSHPPETQASSGAVPPAATRDSGTRRRSATGSCLPETQAPGGAVPPAATYPRPQAPGGQVPLWSHELQLPHEGPTSGISRSIPMIDADFWFTREQ